MRMHCILTGNKDIYFNLASEEYLLKTKEENYFMLWQSDPCVVVGKHQNAMAEINYRFIKDYKIPVARRLTGGGTVYHDTGNLNFTFIMNGEKGKLVDFARYFKPVIEFFHSKNILARPGTKNEIFVNGLKISGNAEHIYKNRVLHHGTLLFNTNLELLRDSIDKKTGIYIDKAVQSNRSEVGNISEFLTANIDIDRFIMDFFHFIKEYYTNTCEYQFTKQEREKIIELRNSKYCTWEWIFGYSPEFEIQKTIIYKTIRLELNLKIRNGIVQEAKLTSKAIRELEENFPRGLIGIKYDYNVIEEALNKMQLKTTGIIESILQNIF